MFTINITRRGYGRLAGLSDADTLRLLRAAAQQRRISRTAWFLADAIPGKEQYFLQPDAVDDFAAFANEVLGQVHIAEPGAARRVLRHDAPLGLDKFAPRVDDSRVPEWVTEEPRPSVAVLAEKFGAAPASQISAALSLRDRGRLGDVETLHRVAQIIATA